MSLRQIFEKTSDATIKGQAIEALANSKQGANNLATLAMAGALSDQETFTLGATTYELHLINTASGSTSTVLDNTDDIQVIETITAHGLLKGAVLRVGLEFLKVTSVVNADQVQLARAQFGSTIVDHADGAAILRAAQVPSLGRIVPISTTAQDSADSEIATALNMYFADGYSGLNAVAGTNEVVISAPFSEAGVTNSEAMTNATLTNFEGGYDAGGFSKAEIRHVASAADVTVGEVVFNVDFNPAGADVKVFAANGSVRAWNGNTSFSGQTVTFDNAGGVDFVDTDVMFITIFG